MVEDDRAICTLMRTLFASRGFDVRVAHTVAEGIASLEALPHYLLLDITLPDGNGRQVLEEVRGRMLPTRVAVTTGWGDLHGVEDLHPDVVLCKPVGFDELWDGLGISAEGRRPCGSGSASCDPGSW